MPSLNGKVQTLQNVSLVKLETTETHECIRQIIRVNYFK